MARGLVDTESGDVVAVKPLTAVHLATESRKASAFPQATKERAAAQAVEFKLPRVA
ncbi:MAG TPA: hypothetical protein VGK44_04850 [Casimicrobiaceae bacterium]|jgi:hypothetical protein